MAASRRLLMLGMEKKGGEGRFEFWFAMVATRGSVVSRLSLKLLEYDVVPFEYQIVMISLA